MARKTKAGLWAQNLNLTALKGDVEKQFNEVNFTKNGTILEVNLKYEFYVEPEGCKRVVVPQSPKAV